MRRRNLITTWCVLAMAISLASIGLWSCFRYADWICFQLTVNGLVLAGGFALGATVAQTNQAKE